MHKYIVLVLGIAVLLGSVACQQKHPVSVYIDDSFRVTAGETPPVLKIAVLPFTSSINQSDDPDDVASRTFESVFTKKLDDRNDYNFVSPGTIAFAVEREGWQSDYKKFLRDYPHSDKPDMDLLGRIAAAVQCDAFLIGVVDTWDKDEVDYRENASATTTVGATISIVDASVKPGRLLFRAIDEDYLESARSEVSDRTVSTSGTGLVRADREAQLYKAPPYEEVVIKVVESLVASLPAR